LKVFLKKTINKLGGLYASFIPMFLMLFKKIVETTH